MNVRCPKCGRWLLEVTSFEAIPGSESVDLRINCMGCKQRWLMHLRQGGVNLEVPESGEAAGSAAASLEP